MDKLFYPKSVAVFGVSERADNLARNIVENLFEFQFPGEIFMVGRRDSILFGRRICTSVEDLPEGIDVAVILTPAQAVPGILDGCGRKKIRWAVIETGGFSEYSEEGDNLARELLQIARKWGMRIVGPNGIGVMNVHNGFMVPFVNLKRGPVVKGKLSILAQSGGVLLNYARLLTSANVGLSKLVSMGNKLDLNEIDYLKYLVEDPQTEIIGLYLESLERGRELMEIARSTRKPVIVHKANTGEGSRQIARLHTAALANDDQVVEAALKQADIIRTRDFRSFVNAVKILSLPPMKGRRLVIISRSGGIGVVAADAAERYGFRLLAPDRNLQERFHSFFRAKVIQPTNPLDLGDLFNFDLYTNILDQVLRIDVVDGILFQHAATAEEEKEPSRRFIHAVKEISARYHKPVALEYITDEEETARIKRSFDYPIFIEPEDALAALAISREHHRKLNVAREKPPSFTVDRNRVDSILREAKNQKRDLLLPEALAVLQTYGIPVADYRVVRRKDEIAEALETLGTPVALKVVSKEISHKSDIGGVALGIDRTEKAEEFYDRMKAAGGSFDGVLAQKMISRGKEVIFGGKRDASFGPVILFGLGGIFVEVLREGTLRAAPISRFEAEEMISELRGGTILKGVRGEPPSDIQALVEILLRLSQLLVDFPEVEGVDINPVMALEKGAVAVDARFVLRHE